MFLAIVSVTIAYWFFSRALSEAQMISHFHAHKGEFEQIRLMLARDKNVRVIGPDWTLTQSEFDSQGRWTRDLPLDVSPARLALYRQHMNKLGFTNVYVYEQDHRIHFPLFGGGFTDTTWNIGYAYSPEAPTPLVKSAYNEYPGKYKTHFTRIEGDWYIYHSR